MFHAIKNEHKLLNNPKRICWPDSHIPMSAPLEKAFYPSKERLINEIKSTLINDILWMML